MFHRPVMLFANYAAVTSVRGLLNRLAILGNFPKRLPHGMNSINVVFPQLGKKIM
jgi:hypothetical protein